MGDRARAAALGILAATVTVAVHFAVLQVWVGPFPVVWEWDHLAFFVLPAVMALVITGTVSDIGDERAGRWLRERAVPDTGHARADARRWLRLTRTCRGVGFFGVAMLTNVAAWATNFGFPRDTQVQERLVDIASTGLPGLEGWSPPILGYAVGAVVAEALRRRLDDGPKDSVVRADLRPRVPAAYMHPLARWGPGALATAGVAVAAVTHMAGVQVVTGPSSTVLAAVSVGTLAAAETVRWIVVRHRQRAATPEAVAFDDAARTTTLHAVSGSAIAIIGQALGTHLGNVSLDLAGPWRWLAMGGSLVSLVSLGIWLGYGVGLVWVVQRGHRAVPRTAEPGT